MDLLSSGAFQIGKSQEKCAFGRLSTAAYGKKAAIFTLLILLSLQLVQAQQTLLVQKYGGNRRYKFQEGATIKLKLKDSREVLTGSWQYAGPQTIKVGERRVELSNIRWLDVSAHEKGVWVLRKGQDLLMIAGLGYFASAHINIPFDTGEFGIDRQVSKDSGMLVAGSLFCAGLDRILHRRKLPVNSRRFGISVVRLP